MLGPSMRMMQSANLLRIFGRMKEGLRVYLEAKRASAKRRYDVDEAGRYEKWIEEVNDKRFHQIGTFEDLSKWMAELGKRWNIPVGKQIEKALRTNPLREIFSKKKKTTPLASDVAVEVKRAFRAVLSSSDRFFSRFYILSGIYPALALREITERHGPFNGVSFDSVHPVLRQAPYPLSLYLLPEKEISELLEALPEVEQKEILGKIRGRRLLLTTHVAEFNTISRAASAEFASALGEAWRRGLIEGVLPERQRILSMVESGNALAAELARLLIVLAEQDAVKVRERNQTLSALNLMEIQEQYQKYLRDFNSAGLTQKRIGNLIQKTEEAIAVMQKAQRILTGDGTAPKRRIRLHPVG